MPTEREFLRYFTDVDLLDVGFVKTGNQVVSFRLNYRAKIGQTWFQVVRYDNAHGQPLHIHRFWPPHDGRKDPLEKHPKKDYTTAFDEALRDLEDNWRRYRAFVERNIKRRRDRP